MEMTIVEAILYVGKANGMPYTEELRNKIRDFLHKLPRNPETYDFYSVIVTDYYEGLSYVVSMGRDEYEKMYIHAIAKPLEKSDIRVRDNHEALDIIRQINELKWAGDIDKYWDMTDDHKYWNRMNQHNNDVRYQREMLIRKLR